MTVGSVDIHSVHEQQNVILIDATLQKATYGGLVVQPVAKMRKFHSRTSSIA